MNNKSSTSILLLLTLLTIIPVACTNSVIDKKAPILEDTIVSVDNNINKKDLADLIDGNTIFGITLYKHLAKNKGNIVFSPYTISNAYSIIYAGAKGNTKKEIEDVFQYKLSQSVLFKSFAYINNQVKTLNKDKNITINIVNSLWIDNNYEFLTEYLNIIKKYSGGVLFYIDFKSNKFEIEKEINKWIGNKTNKKITDIVKSENIKDEAKLVLVNTIYLKSKWINPIYKETTRNEIFWLEPGKSIKTPMMFTAILSNYMDNKDLKILEMPLKGNLSMIFLLPRKIDGISALEDKLNYEYFNECMNKLNKIPVYVSIPKYKVTENINLVNILRSLGLKDAFNKYKANFEGIAKKKIDENLFVSESLHKTYLDVNEGGIEAVAATLILMDRAVTSAGVEKFKGKRFIADHPFIFIICQNETNNILFMGRVVDPRISQ